jgi:HlyD family secretion protein
MHTRLANNRVRDTRAQDNVLTTPARNPKFWQRREALIGLGVLAVVLVVAIMKVWLSTSAAVPRDRVRLADVALGAFVRDVAADGTVVAASSPTLYAPAAGTISYEVTAGAAVTKGQLLGTVSSPELVNEHAREEATLARIENELGRQELELQRQVLKIRAASNLAGLKLTSAQRELQREEAAWTQHVIPERDLLHARDEVDAARVQRDEATDASKLEEASLRFDLKAKQLERDRQKLVVADLARKLDELAIRSPVTGSVGNLAVAQKATVAADSPLLTVVDLSQLEIEFQVPETYAASLGAGMEASIAYSADNFPGKVTAISPEVHNNQVTGRVRFANRVPTGLRQNQRVTLRIIIDSRPKVLKVERGPFVDSGNMAYVVKDGIAERRAIRIGAMSVGEVEILSGLSAGERIVVSDLGEFKNAPRVRLTN